MAGLAGKSRPWSYERSRDQNECVRCRKVITVIKGRFEVMQCLSNAMVEDPNNLKEVPKVVYNNYQCR